MIKLIPGFDDEVLLAISLHSTTVKAMVLELYGTGNSPSRRETFIKFVQVNLPTLRLVTRIWVFYGGLSLSVFKLVIHRAALNKVDSPYADCTVPWAGDTRVGVIFQHPFHMTLR